MQVESESSDSGFWLEPDNPVMSHVGAVIDQLQRAPEAVIRQHDQ